MSADLGLLHPDFAPYAIALVELCGQAGLLPQVTSTLRTFAEQKQLFERFQAGASSLPAAPPGKSVHEIGCAFDMVIADDSLMHFVGRYWQTQIGGTWGGTFSVPDPVHFEASPDFIAAVAQEIVDKYSLGIASLETAAGFLVSLPVSAAATLVEKLRPSLWQRMTAELPALRDILPLF